MKIFGQLFEKLCTQNLEPTKKKIGKNTKKILRWKWKTLLSEKSDKIGTCIYENVSIDSFFSESQYK